jgi:hypothetical protein
LNISCDLMFLVEETKEKRHWFRVGCPAGCSSSGRHLSPVDDNDVSFQAAGSISRCGMLEKVTD